MNECEEREQLLTSIVSHKTHNICEVYGRTYTCVHAPIFRLLRVPQESIRRNRTKEDKKGGKRKEKKRRET